MTRVLITRRPVRGPVSRSVPRLAVRVLPILGLLGLWTVIALVFDSLKVIPAPWEVVAAFIGDLPVYPGNVGYTLANAGVGYVAGNVIAIAAAVLFVRVPWAERVLMRVAVLSFCIPLVAITPILVVLFPDDVPKQILAGISVLFTTIVSCLLGLRSLTPATVDLIRSMGGTEHTVLVKARLTAMLPSLFVGLQIAAPAAIIGELLGEYLGAERGLGVMLIQAQSSFQVSRTWAIAATMSALAGAVFVATGLIGRTLTPWVGRDVAVSVGQGMQSRLGLSAGKSAGAAALAALGSTVLIVGVWWAGIPALGLNSYFAKTPADVFTYLVTDPDAAVNGERILAGLGITLRDAGIGYFVGTLAACIVAVAVVTSTVIERSIMPVAIVIRSVPLVAIVPLLTLVFGRELLGVTVIVSLVSFFPTLVNVTQALRNAPILACDVVRSMGGKSAAETTKVRLLYAMPAVFASARIAVPGAIAGATLAEWLATGEGLGSMLVRDFAASNFNALWAETAVVVVVSIAAYALVSFIERPIAARYTGAA